MRTFWRTVCGGRRGLWKKSGLVLPVVFAFIAGAVVLPVSGNSQNQDGGPKREIPAPTGKYTVGRTSLYWIDAARGEAMTDDPADRRELMVTLWYPAESATGDTAPYIDQLDKLAAAVKHPYLIFARSIPTHSFTDAKISSAERRYPVLIFSPGNGANAALYSVQIEDLASHGYIVLGIDHPYDALAVLYPDGRIARYSEEKRPKPNAPNFPEESARFYRERVNLWVSDAAFAVNQLALLDSGKPASQFKGRLDLRRIGALGHSIGGIASAQICQSDPRVKACLNLDGHSQSLPFYLNADGSGPAQPFMIVEDVTPAPTEQQLAEWKTTREQVEQGRERAQNRATEALKTVKSGSYRVTLSGATHQSFSDEALVMSFGDHNSKLAHRRRTEIIRAYTLAFFDQYLKGRPSTLLNASSSNYPEVTVERFSPPRH